MPDDGGDGPVETAKEVEVRVCRKCLMRGGTRSGGLDLPCWLQGAFAERGLSEQVRVLPTGCMNQCPRGQVTVLVTSGDGRGGSMLMVDPRHQREKLVQLVERKARGAPVPPVKDERGTGPRQSLPAQGAHAAAPQPSAAHGDGRGPEPPAPAGDDRGHGPSHHGP